ncbi:MAG: 4-(cytidine 5'-diphospho)-2-C-methyl-D-erythritol kinase [Puniceicoccales bacterium]|jgi:4-diphosphocytidyl-2-C-methyl-D-erythritol kinase|nr:4-(cytidine 5'-diphospho)-2-C-methyl-D-erythritol kinase [Puniceicoccales bacterium]
MGLYRRVECPAKINLCLYVVGKRDDFFHDVVSLVVQLDFCDRLGIRFSDVAENDMLICDVPGIPTDHHNILMRTLEVFRATYDFPYHISLSLEKNIPVGSGMGGGSSDAAILLKTLNEMLAFPIDEEQLRKMAAQIGADVPLFLSSSPCIVKGRGEIVLAVNGKRLKWLRKTKFLIFKPLFSVPTKHAYEILESDNVRYHTYTSVATENVQQILIGMEEEKHFPDFWNVFQSIIGEKYTELGLIFSDLQKYFRTKAYLTGTGSACFIPLADNFDAGPIAEYLREVLGKSTFIIETHARMFDAPTLDR